LFVALCLTQRQYVPMPQTIKTEKSHGLDNLSVYTPAALTMFTL
jgi:hypothetical protein